MDQWNRIESPEINPCQYSRLIFDKVGRNIKWSKNSLVNKWCWEIWTNTCKYICKYISKYIYSKNIYIVKPDHQFPLYTKINSRWIKDLNISHYSVKILEENIGRKISNIRLSNIFTNTYPRARYIKVRTKKWGYTKLKKLLYG